MMPVATQLAAGVSSEHAEDPHRRDDTETQRRVPEALQARGVQDGMRRVRREAGILQKRLGIRQEIGYNPNCRATSLRGTALVELAPRAEFFSGKIFSNSHIIPESMCYNIITARETEREET